MLRICIVLQVATKLPSKVAGTVWILMSNFYCSQSHQYLIFMSVLDFSHLIDVYWYLIVMVYNFLMTYDVNHVFICLFGIFFDEVAVAIYFCFFNQIIFLLFWFKKCFCLLYIFFSFIFSWRLITLQYCSGFCHTLTWISHGFTAVYFE